MTKPKYDVFVCHGKVCGGLKSAELYSYTLNWIDENGQSEHVRVRRGGCYGLCDLANNVVVRRYEPSRDFPQEEADLLTLTHQTNETVYSTIGEDELEIIMNTHIANDAVVEHYTLAQREAETKPMSKTMERIRQLRSKRAAKRQSS